MRVGIVMLAIALALLACGNGDADGDSASAFAEQTLEQARKGQNGRRWDDLHPAQQAIVSKEAFIACTQDDSFPVDDIDATEEFPETVTVPEVGQMETTAVTVEYSIGDRSDAITMHFLEVDGDWKWFITPDDLAAFAAGECP